MVWGDGRYEPGSLAKVVEALASAGLREFVITPPQVGRSAVEEEAKQLTGVKLDLGGGPFSLWRPPPAQSA